MARLELASGAWRAPVFALTPHPYIGASDENRTRTRELEAPRACPLHHARLQAHLRERLLGLVTGIEPARYRKH
jgi:hypothetical protein